MKYLYWIVAIIIIALAFLIVYTAEAPADPAPRQSGNSFFAYKDLIKLETPLPEETITSPLTVRGEARGSWFFEANFPVLLTDWDGVIIAEGYASVDEGYEWMTEEYVPFTATLTFSAPTDVSNRGSLILKKANASDLPEHDDALEVSVRFEDMQQARGSCVISGCSSQICASEEIASTCIWKEEYACYRTAICEVQNDGECGWTPTESLRSCLTNSGALEGN